MTNHWFVKRKGLVVGMLTASAATGQMLFLPLLARITVNVGWRYAIYTSVGVIVILIAIVAIWMRDHPYDVGAAPYGAEQQVKPTPFTGNIFLAPLLTLRSAFKSKTYWLLGHLLLLRVLDERIDRHGLDWIATVPPTVKLTSKEFGKEKAGMIFGWIVAAHQLGASAAAYGAGMLWEHLGSYTVPFIAAGFVCLFAALMSVRTSRLVNRSEVQQLG